MLWLPLSTLERTEQIALALDGFRVPGQRTASGYAESRLGSDSAAAARTTPDAIRRAVAVE